jgi:GNAT superfamily N-acetyltransferase
LSRLHAPQHLHIRALGPGDLAAVHRLQALCYPPDYQEPAAAFAAKLQASPRTLWGADHPVMAGELMAYLICLPVRGLQWPGLHATTQTPAEHADALYLHDLSLHPDARGLGLGQALVRHAMAWALEHGLRRVLLMAVQGSQAYWRQQGFTPIAPAVLAQHGAELNSFGERATAMWRPIGQ